MYQIFHTNSSYFNYPTENPSYIIPEFPEFSISKNAMEQRTQIETIYNKVVKILNF